MDATLSSSVRTSGSDTIVSPSQHCLGVILAINPYCIKTAILSYASTYINDAGFIQWIIRQESIWVEILLAVEGVELAVIDRRCISSPGHVIDDDI